ncbi:lipoyl(octanoyl) transferase LipB [Phytohalomonas tamaricis]|uniref:lipoyl(octanoyl) transferase LipB n=1 Tax=Phytohalomonas tamaricis TaxID=2081032 RepID=UPI000D0B5EAA|nr:lipoyl(octanoyl) transferase LipB [Phytohalomonas tamaricis]
MADTDTVDVYYLGQQPYEQVWQAMRTYTDTRDQASRDQLWVVEHAPVFTQGQAGKSEHVLGAGDIPVIQTDRGGQVTYHGPGQIVLYPLLDVRRRELGVRALVNALENAVIEALSEHDIIARARSDAPGVYVGEAKIASLGLRIRRGSSFHGIAFNIDMDLSPFRRINPCGYAGMAMTQLRDLIDAAPDMAAERKRLVRCLAQQLGDTSFIAASGEPDVLAETSRRVG